MTVSDSERRSYPQKDNLAWPLLLPGSNPGASTASAMQEANRWRAEHLPMQERPADIYAHAQGGGRIETAQSSEWRPRYAVVPGWTVRGRLGCAAPVRWQWPVGAVLAFVLALAKHRPGYRRRPAARDPAQAFCSVLSISSAGQPAVPHRRDTRRRAGLLAPDSGDDRASRAERCRHCPGLGISRLPATTSASADASAAGQLTPSAHPRCRAERDPSATDPLFCRCQLRCSQRSRRSRAPGARHEWSHWCRSTWRAV
jgi:hypothetical protein